MKILILSQYCSPEPQFKGVPFARELIRRGHEVRILTGFPNYPGGSIYPGYRLRWWQKEEISGVPVLRVPLYPSHDGSSVRRALSYGSFAAAAVGPLLLGWKPDLIYVYSLVTKGFVASLAGAWRGVPFVIDIQDLWPDAVLNSGLGKSWMVGPLHALCRWVYRRAARVIVQSPGFKRTLVGRGVPENKIEVIYNWCDEEELLATGAEPEATDELKPGEHFNILYAGGMGRAQGLHAVVEAAALAGRANPRIRFAFMGTGRLLEELKAQAARIAPEQTLFLARRPMRQASAVLRKADVLLIHLRKNPLYEITIPSKTQSYLALGKPILIGVEGDAGDLVKRAGAGLPCASEEPASIAQAALRMAAMPPAALAELAAQGRAFYARELSLATGAARMEAVFERVVREFAGAR